MIFMAMSDLVFENRCLEKFITPRESWSPVDKALFTPASFFGDYKKAQDLIFTSIKYSFKHHYDGNVLYHKVCEVNGVTPDKIKSKNDLSKIFKKTCLICSRSIRTGGKSEA